MLQEFIASTWRQPFGWADTHCAFWCADGVKFCTGVDPAADLRGRFQTQFEWRRFIMSRGGLLNAVSERMRGFQDLVGDGVAVVRIDGRQLCAFVVDGRAQARTEQGIRVADDFTLVRGWSWSNW